MNQQGTLHRQPIPDSEWYDLMEEQGSTMLVETIFEVFNIV